MKNKILLLNISLWVSIGSLFGASIEPLPIVKNGVNTKNERSVSFCISDYEDLDGLLLGNQYFLNELEVDIQNYNKKNSFIPPDDPPEDANFVSFMAGLGSVTGVNDFGAKANKINSLIDDAMIAGNFIDKLTGGNVVSMPLVMQNTFGTNTVDIVFDEAKIYPNFCKLKVYIRITMDGRKDFHGNPVKLFFGSDEIYFSQDKGILAGNVGLLEDYSLRVGDANSTGILLKKMESELSADPEDEEVNNDNNPMNDVKNYSGTYINFDCDGFNEIGIGGTLFLSRQWVLPTDTDGEVLDDVNARVKIEIPTLQFQDFNNVLIEQLEIDPFVLAAYPKVSLSLTNANFDWSDYANPSGIPDRYKTDPVFSYLTENDWHGVYIEQIDLTMPKPFKRKCDGYGYEDLMIEDNGISDLAISTSEKHEQIVWRPNPESKGGPNGLDMYIPEVETIPMAEGCRIKFTAKDLIVDEYGVSGKFSITGQSPLINGATMNGRWNYSLDKVEVGIVHSDFDYFEIDGSILMPLYDKETPLLYSASLGESGQDCTGDDYDGKIFEFVIQEVDDENGKNIPIWNAANVNVTNKEFGVCISGDDFSASFKADMTVTVGNPNDIKENEGGSPVKIPSLVLTGVKLQTHAPLISVQSIGVDGSGTRLMNFPVTFSGLPQFVKGANEETCKIVFGVQVNLGDDADGGLTAEGTFYVQGKLTKNVNGGDQWKYDKLVVTGLQVDIELSQFEAHGQITSFQKDPTYGDGFSGSLDVSVLNGKFNGTFAGIFGSTGGISEEEEGFRYWMVDGMIGSSAINVPLFGPFYLNGFGGGAFHHMRPASSLPPEEVLAENTAFPAGTDVTGLVYKPYHDTSFGIKFNTTIASKPDIGNGVMTCILRFSDSALQDITFWSAMQLFNEAEISTASVTDGITGEMEKITKLKSEVAEENKEETEDDSQDGIFANLGVNLNFEQGFKMHGYASVNMNYSDANLYGSGALDFLIDTDNKLYHLYIGGYYDNSVKIYNFFGEYDEDGNFIDEPTEVLPPVYVGIEAGNVNISADCYFLLGNDLPGPPPMDPRLVAIFGPEGPNNRDLLNCDKAQGMGIAFGASAWLKLNFDAKGWFCVPGVKVRVLTTVGFDLALLKYDQSNTCQYTQGPIGGIHGWRATGRAWAYAGLEELRLFCVKLPKLGAGVKVRFDVINPSFFEGIFILEAGFTLRKKFKIGDECGAGCSVKTIEG